MKGGEKKERPGVKGIPIRKLNYVMAAITLVVSVVLIVVSYRTLVVYNALQDKTKLFVSAQKNAQDMQAASDYLTEQVRCFAESGERVYLDAYFTENDVTRRREKALEELKSSFGGTAEYSALEKAVEQSIALMDTEFYAMRLTAEAYGEDLTTYPEKIRSVEVSVEDAALGAEEKKAKARRLVFDDDYHYRKAIISAETQECLNSIVNDLQEQQTAVSDSFGVLISVELGLIIALIVIVLAIVTLTTLQVIVPLIRAIPHIRDDNPIPIDGAEEFRYLASTYNRMYEENKMRKKELAYEASHDQLTGVFNRKGFVKILNGVDRAKVALLLIDVDRFKAVNDTYGHAEGDRILAYVTRVLAEHFRATDSLCRIGGDEFALFMFDADAEDRAMIEAKIAEINGILLSGEDGSPSVSVSVGVAFGRFENGTKVYKNADVALYRVKERGGAGCAFYEKE